MLLGYAKGSAGELRSQLYIALNQKYLTEEQFQVAFKSATEISSQLSKFSTYLRFAPARKLSGIARALFAIFHLPFSIFCLFLCQTSTR